MSRVTIDKFFGKKGNTETLNLQACHEIYLLKKNLIGFVL